jgi:heme/copper-type cytochrome/quinol oxidase subunit 3
MMESGGGEPVSATPVLLESAEEIAYERRAAEGAIWTGTRLVIGICAFALASLAFAYFYLRSSNNEDLWRPHGVTAPTAIGAAIFALTAAVALLDLYGNGRLRRDLSLDFQVAGWITVTGGLTAVGLQIWELTRLPFFPGSSGYASCFIGWAAMNIALLLGGVYWTETLLARSLRLRRAMSEEGGSATASLPLARQYRANVEGCALFWSFIAVASTIFWLLFYVI